MTETGHRRKRSDAVAATPASLRVFCVEAAVAAAMRTRPQSDRTFLAMARTVENARDRAIHANAESYASNRCSRRRACNSGVSPIPQANVIGSAPADLSAAETADSPSVVMARGRLRISLHGRRPNPQSTSTAAAHDDLAAPNATAVRCWPDGAGLSPPKVAMEMTAKTNEKARSDSERAAARPGSLRVRRGRGGEASVTLGGRRAGAPSRSGP